MRKALRHIIIASIAVVPAAALAQSDIPDLTGNWSTKYQAVILRNTGDRKPFLAEVDGSLVIESQEGFRFYGHELDQASVDGTKEIIPGERLAGVIAPDGKTAHMVDENGMIDCQIEPADEMQCLYRHIDTSHNAVAWGVWKKASK